MPLHVPNLVHWSRRSIAWFIKRKTIILIYINYTSSNAFTNVVRSWLESDPVTVGLSSGAFPNPLLTKRSRRFCPLLNAVTHRLYRMFGCFALSLLKEVFTNLAASTAVVEWVITKRVTPLYLGEGTVFKPNGEYVFRANCVMLFLLYSSILQDTTLSDGSPCSSRN